MDCHHFHCYCVMWIHIICTSSSVSIHKHMFICPCAYSYCIHIYPKSISIFLTQHLFTLAEFEVLSNKHHLHSEVSSLLFLLMNSALYSKWSTERHSSCLTPQLHPFPHMGLSTENLSTISLAPANVPYLFTTQMMSFHQSICFRISVMYF